MVSTLTDDSVFVHQAISECLEETGLNEYDVFPHSDRCRFSILQRAQELKLEYHKQTEAI